MDSLALGVHRNQCKHLLNHLLQVEGLRLEVDRLCEIQESLDDGVEALDFTRDHIHLGMIPNQFSTQDLQMQSHGIQRILDFVRHASGKTADGRQSR